ncbi:hypothetical protein TWF730_004805 [Orbilia blumenaviensis]|uniref:F-box domain-containing protein n=1 Tax=Orbilia blumenaviensis TaxID=1796055 RepID=A0AAV9TX47_9PEZI
MQNSRNKEDNPRGSGPPATLGLLSLPEELIELVCEQLSSDRDSKSLASLCRASRDLNRIATYALYSRFASNGDLRRLALFLRTLCERPELGASVRSLSLAVDSWFDCPPEYIGFVTETAERFGFDVGLPTVYNYNDRALVRGLEEGEYGDSEGEDQAQSDDRRKSELENGYDRNDEEIESEEDIGQSQLDLYPFETIAQLTIALTPNIQSLDVVAKQIMCDTGEGAFTMLEELAQQSPPPISLLRLHHFSFGHEDCREVSFKYFEGVIALAPNIRTIHAHPCFDQPRYAPKAPVNIKNVTDLRFKSGHLSARGLRAIVSSCNRLEIFQYCYDTIYAGLDPGCATPREIAEILSQHKDSLKYMDIDLGSREEHQGGLFFGFCIAGEEIESLKEFSCLETFKIDGSSILFPEAGSDKCHTNILLDMLPQSIRILHLKDTQIEAAANLITLTESLDSFPNLCEVFLAGNGIGGPLGKFEVAFEDSEIQILRERFKSRGISFLKPGQWRNAFISDDVEPTEDW